MDFLDNHYISEDELLNIAYNTAPENIFAFCQISKITNNICKKISWRKYINGDQYKYDKLLMIAAENGYYKVFEHLIKNKEKYGVIINKIVVRQSFRLAVINGYDEFADYIWSIFITDVRYLQRGKYQILLEQYIESGKLKTSIKLLENIVETYDKYKPSDDISFIVNTSLGKSPSYKFMTRFINLAKNKFKKIYKVDIDSIFWLACSVGNMNLVRQMLSESLKLDTSFVIYGLLSCPSSIALKLLKRKFPLYQHFVPIEYIIDGTIILRNPDIVYDLVNRLSKSRASIVFLLSPLAFKPYEFIDMLNYENLCYNSATAEAVMFILDSQYETYYAKILEEDAPLCEK